MKVKAPNFEGRTEYLTQLMKEFNKEAPLLTTILGLGGVGKSELVKKFGSDLFSAGLANCVWLDCSGPQSFSRSVQIFVKDCKLELDNMDLSFAFQQAYKSVPDLSTLLILDNVDELFVELEDFVKSFRNYGPSVRPPFVVVTTRIREVALSIGGELIELPVLSDKEAIALIQSCPTGCEIVEEAAELSKLLQNFPLAIQQAIAYIRERGRVKRLKPFTIREYIELFQRQKAKLLSHKLCLTQHDYALTTVTTWNLNFESIVDHPDLVVWPEKY